ncbi:MAG: radical SAM protein [Lachnospiraceae bacterium]|nr:radical SAM protein [Lachnospiraceae bacterium]
MLEEKRYELKNWKNVIHTTWDPQGPGVIRIHMIPPKFHWFRTAPAIVILNGQEILPLNESWAILLTEFVNRVNAFGPGEMSEKDLEFVLQDVFHNVRKVYPSVSDEELKEDLGTIIETFEAVIHGEVPRQEIGLLSIGEYAPHMTAPHRMDLMVSAMAQNGQWHCNQKCLHCYAAGQALAETPELSTEEWKRIIDNCRKAEIPQITFTGGEPTLRKDLCELVAHARWFITRLNTNGVLLTPELCKKLVEAELDSVQVTFYSANQEVHNRLVGAENYEKTLAGIKNALAAGLNLSINTPLCSLNQDYVQTLRFLKELGVRYVTCSGLIVTGNAVKEDSVVTQLSSDVIYGIVREASEYCFANGMEINFTSPGWIAEEKLKALGLDVPSCGACLSNMAVTPDGKVIPCQSWLSEETLGDMQKDSWKKIWNYPVCKKHRAFSAQMKQVCPLRGKAGEAKC